ncbi:hypothetical protein HAV15_004703 [Penicillium sp. str. |nr:hypothetical protein HAV15_004703 [Penicillium sp. str. \
MLDHAIIPIPIEEFFKGKAKLIKSAFHLFHQFFELFDQGMLVIRDPTNFCLISPFFGHTRPKWPRLTMIYFSAACMREAQDIERQVSDYRSRKFWPVILPYNEREDQFPERDYPDYPSALRCPQKDGSKCH